MGKMREGIHFTGTIGNICFYQVGDRTYARAKSSLTRKRVLKDKEFRKTRRYANDLGRASRIGSEIYKALPGDIKGRWIFRAITGEAASLLYEGKTEQEVKAILWEKYIAKTGCGNREAAKGNRVNVVSSTKKSRGYLKAIFLERWKKQGKEDFYFEFAWRDRQYRPEYFLGFD